MYISSGFLKVSMTKLLNSSYVQAYMQQVTGSRTVPRVFIGGECIGGGAETRAEDRSGKLLERLLSAGALSLYRERI